VALRRLPYHGKECSFFATREKYGESPSEFHIYATMEVDCQHALEVFDEDVTERVRVLSPDVCHVALRRAGEVVLLLGGTSGGSCQGAIEMGELLAPDATYRVSLYDSLSQTWRQVGADAGATLRNPALGIEPAGFKILRFVQVSEDATELPAAMPDGDGARTQTDKGAEGTGTEKQ